MKYVMLRRGAFRFPVVFPDAVEHAQFEGADVVSAGFVRKEGDGYVAYGKGGSLEAKYGKHAHANPDTDNPILTAMLNWKEAVIPLAQLT